MNVGEAQPARLAAAVLSIKGGRLAAAVGAPATTVMEGALLFDVHVDQLAAPMAFIAHHPPG